MKKKEEKKKVRNLNILYYTFNTTEREYVDEDSAIIVIALCVGRSVGANEGELAKTGNRKQNAMPSKRVNSR